MQVDEHFRLFLGWLYMDDIRRIHIHHLLGAGVFGKKMRAISLSSFPGIMLQMCLAWRLLSERTLRLLAFAGINMLKCFFEIFENTVNSFVSFK